MKDASYYLPAQRRIIRTEADADQLKDDLGDCDAEWVGADTEFFGPEVRQNIRKKKTFPERSQALVAGFSLYTPHVGAVYVPVRSPEGSDLNLGMDLLQYILQWYPTTWHNLKADLQVLLNEGLWMSSGGMHCSMMMANLGQMHAGPKKSLGLKDLAMKHLGYSDLGNFAELAYDRPANTIPVPEIAPYAMFDAVMAYQMAGMARKRLEYRGMWEYYLDVEQPTIDVTRGMEAAGMPIDAQLLRAYEKPLQEQSDALAEEFRELTETTVVMPGKKKVFDGLYKKGTVKMKTVPCEVEKVLGAQVSSDDQVRRWLHHELKWWPMTGPKTDGGGCKTDKHTVGNWLVLGGNAAKAARIRLDFGARAKLLSTFTGSLVAAAAQYPDGRLHGTFNQAGTITGRYAVSNPGLQQMPSRTVVGVNIRKAFRAPPGFKFLVADYSQLELRLIAHLARDQAMIEAFVSGGDPHQVTMDALGIDRPSAKIVNFSTIYGISDFSLAAKMCIGGCPTTQREAGQHIHGFFGQYEGIAKYHELAPAYVKKHGYSNSLGGRRVYFPKHPPHGLSKKDLKGWLSSQERNAINYPVQSSAGYLVKLGALAYMKVAGSWAPLICNVHDELIALAPEDRAEEAGQLMTKSMENVYPELAVPLLAPYGIGDTWDDAK